MKKELRDQFIVKVQLPLFSSAGAPVMVYNEDRSKQEMFDLTVKQFRELSNALDGEPKGFFYAHIENKKIILDEPAPWQSW